MGTIMLASSLWRERCGRGLAGSALTAEIADDGVGPGLEPGQDQDLTEARR